ncbi:YqgE/AlgH family protein [Ferruginibacter sp. SUN002]|uniref:YqgE/AlgH family protein n=1 Tax=Ferruginibacter sp. SUN002 TaxID=2937789 RepID=UPI003D364821
MNISPGTILISTPTVDDPNFEQVVILITEYNDKGASGFVINKLFSRKLNELIEFKHSKAFPLFEGGPVEKESLYFIHQCPDLIDGGMFIVDSIYLGGNFEQAVKYISNDTIDESDIRLFVGYCGWDPGQLEEEIQESSWVITDIDAQTVFAHPDKIHQLLFPAL